MLKVNVFAQTIFVFALCLPVAGHSGWFSRLFSGLTIGVGRDGRQYIQGDLDDVCDHFQGMESELKALKDSALKDLELGLKALGSPEFNEMSAEDLLDEAKDVRFCYWPAMTPMGGNDSRSGSINTRGNVLYNYSAGLLVPGPMQSSLILHELIEASGLNDNQYDYTALLMVPSLLRQEGHIAAGSSAENKVWDRLRKFYLYHYRKQTEEYRQGNSDEELPETYQLAEGGVTGTGRGGDPFAAGFKALNFAKAILMTYSLDQLRELQTMRVDLDDPLFGARLALSLNTGISLGFQGDVQVLKDLLSKQDWYEVTKIPSGLRVKLNAQKYWQTTFIGLFPNQKHLFDLVTDPSHILRLVPEVTE